jgi:predicted DsbA family dithiol-disulfide isomerase
MMRPWESERLLEPVGAGDHARGPEDAPVTLVQYGDYECPYCAQAHPWLKELQERAGERVRFIFRHFPLDSVHPRARRAAQAAEAAAAQGRFWEMHDLLYDNREALGEEDLLKRYAAELGLDLRRFEEDLANDHHAWRIEEDRLGGTRAGVEGTPAFFVNGVRYTGSIDLDGLLAAVEEAASSSGAALSEGSVVKRTGPLHNLLDEICSERRGVNNRTLRRVVNLADLATRAAGHRRTLRLWTVPQPSV